MVCGFSCSGCHLNEAFDGLTQKSDSTKRRVAELESAILLALKKKYSFHATPTGKSTCCAVRDKQDPGFCLIQAGKLACVSPVERA